jgi:hypothetical protein
MECGVKQGPRSGDLPTPVLVNREGVICFYLFDFALTFAACRFNLREYFTAGFCD